jgi:hypothetical protein
MSRSRTERQAVQVTQGAGNTDAELTKAVDFATLISMSSLNAPDVQKDRLTGRKEIAARLAEQAEEFGSKTSPDPFSADTSDIDPTFECQVADQLELRGHTFEAELRYRRLRGHPTVTTRLALLLDAKGFHEESWQWYLRAARSSNMNSLFRLATICWSRGDRGWAARLAKHAIAQLASNAYTNLTANLDTLARHRKTTSNHDNHRLINSLPNSTDSADAIYIFGSVVLILADRSDIARLAYCTALARGHPLAAISMLDLTRTPVTKKTGTWRLNNMLHDGLNDELEQYSSGEHERDSIDGFLPALKNESQNATIDELIQDIQTPTSRREDAIERILYTAQLVTVLRGYGQFGCYTRTLQHVELAADTVCTKVHHRLAAGAINSAASLINLIRSCSIQQLNNDKHAEQHGPKPPHGKKQETREHRKRVTISGVIRRMATEYFDLTPAHKEVLILLLAGLYPEEVADALDYRKVDIDQIFADAVTRLQEAQQGEQIPTGKLLGAEVDNCFSTEILNSIALLPEWSDAGSTWQRLSRSPTQLLSRQQARTGRS